MLQPLTGGVFSNRVRNGGFEQTNGTNFLGWNGAPQGFRVAVGEGRSNTLALACETPTEDGWRGASQGVTFNRTNIAPITVRGWSRSENVSGSPDRDYSIYVDVIYNDGTYLYGQTLNFSCGTHDWELQELTLFPLKPIRSVALYCIFRGDHSGSVWFDDIAVDELQIAEPTLVFQGAAMDLLPRTNPPLSATSVVETDDGLRMGLAGNQIVSLQVDGQDITGSGPGGFLARDVAAQSGVYLFDNATCPELGLRLDVSITSQTNHIVVEGKVTDVTEQDRAVILLFALPIDADGWQWHQGLRESQLVCGRDEYAQVTAVSGGTTGTMSIYPLALLTQGTTGLGLALDMGSPCLYRLVYHPGTRQLFVACDLGLVPDTEQFPGAANFRFVLFRSDAKWGFRAAWEKLQQIFPDYFTVRSHSQGIWMPFTDISTVQDGSDFGFRYLEGAPPPNVPFDDEHGTLSFRYTEPMTWWMPMATNVPRTLSDAIRVRDDYAEGPAGFHQQMATISKDAAMYDDAGQPSLLFRNTPWCNGAVWSLNPNPLLPASTNAATTYWSDAIKESLYSNTPPTGLDGEYLDSLEGYATAEFNLRREHFRWTSVPLSYTTNTRQPGLFKGLASFEFTRWISADVHQLGRLMFANGVPYRCSFLCPWLDVLGRETDWFPNNTYTPASHQQMAYWRTLSGAKPFSLLMNTDFDAFAPHIESYFQRCLFYGFYPSMFLHDDTNHYWQTPAFYNRDRPLFRKYLPVIRTVAEAGWQPVTVATCDNPAIWVERFGPNSNNVYYYTLFTDSAETQTGVLTVEMDANANTGVVVTELLSGTRLPRSDDGWQVTIASQSTLVVEVHPGPRFHLMEQTPSGHVRLTISTPLELPQILESSLDMLAWQPRITNFPSESPYAIDLPWSLPIGAEFFRLRYQVNR